MLNPMVLSDLVTYRGVTIVILFLQPTIVGHHIAIINSKTHLSEFKSHTLVSLIQEPPTQTPMKTLINGVTVIMAMLNSCLNPILYAFLKVIWIIQV